MSADEYRDDGHVIVLRDDRQCTVECTRPDDCASHTACEGCEGAGFVYPEDEETPCPKCDESGLADPPECFMSTHQDIWVALDDDMWNRRYHTGESLPEPGRYVLEWYSEGGGEEYEVYARFGAELPPSERQDRHA